MSDTAPHALTTDEWEQIMQLPLIKEAWGTHDDESIADFASRVYAVKFAFQSGGPGYVGDLYVLVGDSFGEGPVVLKRDENGSMVSAV